MIAVSAATGRLPRSLGSLNTLDWIPVDILATVVLELGLNPFNQGPQSTTRFYNILNPAKSSWDSLLPAIQSFESFRDAKVVAWEAWLEAFLIEGQSASCTDHRIISGMKLRRFFENLGEKTHGITMESLGAQIKSSTLDKMPSVGEKWTGIWMRQWGY
jgi:hypothetical protein